MSAPATVRLIDAARLWNRLMALARIGATPGGGVNRQALSEEEIIAWRQVIAWAGEAGLTPSTDPAGNLFLTLAGSDPQAPPLLAGSHLDSQPTGGRFDGVAGVLAALEAVVALVEDGITPVRSIIVVAWMNEEGSRFAPGMMGSECFAGVRTVAEIRAVTDLSGISVGEALDRLQRSFPDLPCRPLGFAPSHYLELHIEQGPVLEAAGCPVGIVTGIQGKKTFEVVIEGREGHAGTVPTAERRDAVVAFARIAVGLHAGIGEADAAVKFTIGRLRVEPNAPSVIASRVVFSIDLRHPSNAMLDRLGDRIAAICTDRVAPCSVTVRPLVDAPSNEFDAGLQASIAAAAASLGHAAMPLLSAAGHDARHLAPICPSAMIFIPCRGGESHVEHEWVEPNDLSAGAEVLATVMRQLAG